MPAVCQRRESFSTIILVLESFLIAGPADSAAVCQFRKMHNGEGRKIKNYIEKRVDVPPSLPMGYSDMFKCSVLKKG